MQIRQLKHLARQGLSNYDLKIVKIAFLSYDENAIFKVMVENDTSKISENTDLKHSVYLLRICRPNKHDSTTICSELAWLSFLSRNSDLEISKPVLNCERSLLTITTAPGTLEPRYCVLFKWLSGRIIETGFTSKTTKQVGTFLGYLHNHSQRFQPSENFHRPKWDEDGLLGSQLIELPSNKELFLHLQSSDKTLRLAATKIRESLSTLDQNAKTFGLIHNDLHFGNCVFDRGRIKVFDFDDCGWGYYLYDLAIFLYHLSQQDNFISLKNSLLEGYSSVRPLPKQYELYLEAMIAARGLYLMRYVFLRQDEPKFKQIIYKFANHTIEQMNQFL